MMNKKAEENVMDLLIYILLNISFFGILIFFIYNSSMNGGVEEVYSKKLAIITDSLKEGTSIEFEAKDFFKYFQQGKQAIIVDKEKNIITVKLNGKGRSYYYFNSIDPTINLDATNKSIIIEVKNE